MMCSLMIATVAAPSRAICRIIFMGIVRNRDGDALLASLQVSAVALPSVAGGLQIGVRRDLDGHARSRLPLIPLDAVPTAAIAACLGMIRQRACIGLGRDHCAIGKQEYGAEQGGQPATPLSPAMH